MDDRRFRALVRSALALSFAAPVAIVAACSSESSYPYFTADAGQDASTDAVPTDSSSPDVTTADAAEAGCVDDFDASPVTCTESEQLNPEGTCPPRAGVCGSDGRTYCSAASATKAGVTVVVSTACDQPCGRFMDGGPNVCNAATEYCRGFTQVLSTTWQCRPLSPTCGTPRSCACVPDGGPCTVRDGGAVYVREQGAPTVRAPASEY